MKFFVATAAIMASFISSALAGPLESRGTEYSGGDVTYYNGGLTACGVNLISESQAGAAVSFRVFDSYPAIPVTNPNANPICHANIRVFLPSTGRTIIVPVVDKCYSCQDQDLDLSRRSFLDLGLQFAQGRVGGVQWEFV